jgi:thiamine kinase-like enzyme
VVLPTEITEFGRVVSLVPDLSGASELSVRVLSGGLTNTSYLVDADGSEFVVRIGCDNAPTLGIDRVAEQAAIAMAHDAGITPEILLFAQPEGHLVTRYLSGAHALTIDDMREPEMLHRIARKAIS